MHLGQDAQYEKHQLIFYKILATSLIQVIVIADIVPVIKCMPAYGLCSVTSVRFEPERTGTPFRFFFWRPERRSGPFQVTWRTNCEQSEWT